MTTRKVFPDGTRCCSKCKLILPLDRFTPNYRYCKDCRRVYMREYLKSYPGWAEHHRREQKKYAKRYPEKIKAQQRAATVIGHFLSGKCSTCGKESKLEKHHPDYAQPTQVVLLCGRCHKQIHGRLHVDLQYAKQ